MVLEVSGLKHLTLYNCRGYDHFLERLAKSSSELESFSLIEVLEDVGNIDTLLERFFRSLNSLRYISLVLPENNHSAYHGIISQATVDDVS